MPVASPCFSWPEAHPASRHGTNNATIAAAQAPAARTGAPITSEPEHDALRGGGIAAVIYLRPMSPNDVATLGAEERIYQTPGLLDPATLRSSEA